LVIGLGAAGCKPEDNAAKGPGPAAQRPLRPAAQLGAEVARVGDQPIFAAEVAAQAKREGVSPKAALASLIAFNLLAARAEAMAQKPVPAEDDPGRRRLLVERFLEEEFEPLIRPDKLPEDELKKIYQQNEFRFVHPRMVEVALLSVYTGPLMKPEPRARAEKTARELFDYVSKRPIRTVEDMKEIARDPAWKERKVAFWQFLQGPDRPHGPFGKNVATAIHKLHAPGETSPLIIDDSGFHIARYVDEKAPRNDPFEKVQGELKESYLPHWRKRRFTEWTDELGAKHGMTVFTDRLLAQTGPVAGR
jgi:hypothetical protein